MQNKYLLVVLFAWDEYIEQHYHECIKKALYVMFDYNFFNANKVQI